MARSSSTFAINLLNLLAFGQVDIVTGSNFLGRLPDKQTPNAVDPFTNALLYDIDGVFGGEVRSVVEKRIVTIADSLRVSYSAVPHNEHGKLGHAAASYVLHRHFAQRHAWLVSGLDPDGEAMAGFDSTTATQLLNGHVPNHIITTFEERLGGRGLGLTDLTVLAAALEHLVHKEAIERLPVAYEALNLSISNALSWTQTESVLDSYMAFYLLGCLTDNASHITPMKVRQTRHWVDELYPTWNQTQKFVREVRDRSTPKHESFEFREVSALVEEIGDQYGQWQNHECRFIKEMLVQFEDTGSACAGRVRLSDFYRKAVDEGKWQLGESFDSLVKMGAIDSTDPDDLHVIIANYVYSPSNCVAASSYYSVCCVDECEGLLLDIERKFARPDVAPKEIAAHIAAMPSSTVPANRTLPAWLLRRLNDVAAYHGGLVPLHGRLFMQWMHHAYPRECRYPHVSGATDPMQTRITSDTYASSAASEEEMRFYIDAGTARDHAAGKPAVAVDSEEGCGMWTMQEELVVWHPPAATAALPRTTGATASNDEHVVI